MNKSFDFDKKERNTPYTTPDGFFDKLEVDVWKQVKDEFVDVQTNSDNIQAISSKKAYFYKVSKLRLLIGSAMAVAASVVLAFVINIKSPQQKMYTVSDVDQAFCQLSADDQSFLLSVYQDDVFINE